MAAVNVGTVLYQAGALNAFNIFNSLFFPITNIKSTALVFTLISQWLSTCLAMKCISVILDTLDFGIGHLKNLYRFCGS